VRILGIETSCDETAAAVVEDGSRVLSNIVASQYELHAEYGGVVPEIASRAHAERIMPVLKAAVQEAGLEWGDIDAVAVGHRPGLIGSLLVGVAAGKALAWSLGKPLIGVDHLHAHLYAAAMSGQGGGEGGEGVQDCYPALGLVVSGGHTAIYLCKSPTQLERLGGTIDDAIGEAFDKVAAILGLGHPGGPAIDKLAASADADDRAFEFPISRLGPDSLDFSFSGLKTSVLYAVRGQPRPRSEGGGFTRNHTALSPEQKRDVAASFQRAACKAVVLKLTRAHEATLARGQIVRAILIGGGVSANTRLRGELVALGENLGLTVSLPPMNLCVDNAAMIGALAHRVYLDRGADDLTLTPKPTTAC
jgi:tRNA N6-adenosine threonylcarbamoyltransferase